jgi:hypothetical protein
MNALKLQRFLLALIAASPVAACSSTGDCGGPATHIYSLSLLADAGPAEAGVDAAAGSCEEACIRLAGGYATVEGCRFTKLTENGQSVPAVECKIQSMCEGRRPEGFCPEEAEHFAEASQLEAASVFAFVQLARELRHHRAPRRLIAAARRSRRDEVRHARATAALARRRGARVPRVNVAAMAIRDLETIAIENVIEGCVRETFGAATAWWRALHARDPNVRATYLRIARDETKHAALARELDVWVRARLSLAARHRVERARAAAIGELRTAVGVGGGSEVMPDAAVALRWIDGIFADNIRSLTLSAVP